MQDQDTTAQRTAELEAEGLHPPYSRRLAELETALCECLDALYSAPGSYSQYFEVDPWERLVSEVRR
jgi:hypothetical protein